MAEGKHLVMCIDSSFVSSRHTNISCHVEMGSLQPPLGHAIWGTAGLYYPCMKEFHYITLNECFVINTEVA